MKKSKKETCSTKNETGRNFKKVTERFTEIANEYFSKSDVIPSKPIKLADRLVCTRAKN